MYPVVDYITKSNLFEVGRTKPGQLLSLLFVILNSFLHEEPTHLINLVKKRNLFDLLKYCLYKIQKNSMMSLELIQEMKNIVKKNIVVQVYYAKDEGKSRHANHQREQKQAS